MKQYLPLLRKECAKWNRLLQSRMKQLNQNHTECHATFFDTQPAFNVVLDQPEAYGAPNNTCEKSADSRCLWVDGIHPSQPFHKLVAEGVREHLDSIGFFP